MRRRFWHWFEGLTLVVGALCLLLLFALVVFALFTRGATG